MYSIIVNIVSFFIGLLMTVVLALLMALPIMLIVNYVLSESVLMATFGGPLTFYKALLLNVACRILFNTTQTVTVRD